MKSNQSKTQRQPGRSCVVIIKDKKLLVIKRHCENREIKDYYILPGGGIEGVETPEQAAIREAKEELSIDVKLDHELFSFINFGGTEHYFLVKSYSSEIQGSNEITKANPDDTYEPTWQKLDALQEITLLPEKAKQRIISYAKSKGIVKG